MYLFNIIISFYVELEKIIKTIYDYSHIENLEIPLEKIINNLILEVPLPPRGLYSVQYEMHDQSILLKNSKLNDLFYANFELNILFETFDLDKILIIFQYLMLGIKIVVFSTEIEVLTPIILSCLILLFPFKFPFQVVSILPKESYYLIDNVTPEILGVNEKYYNTFFQDNDIDLTDHLLIVDVDEHNVTGKSNSKEELPLLPKKLKEQLYKKLKNYISLIEKNKQNNKKEPMANYQLIIRNMFLDFQIELLKDYPKYLNSNIYKHPLEKPFKINKFLKKVPSSDWAFYKKFINTQMFTDYIYKRMTPKDKIEQTEVLYFEEKIFLFNEQKENIVFLNSNLFDILNEYKVPKVSSLMDEELLNYYTDEQNHQKLLSEGMLINVINDTNINKELTRTRSFSINTDTNIIKKNINENKPIFNYVLFPKLSNDLFFKNEIKNYYLDVSIYNEIKNINSELISKSHLSRVETQTNEMTNFVYILWLKVWANSFYYHDKKEQKYRYYQMLKVFNKISQHEMSVISNLFQGLIIGNADEDLIFHLYNKILQCNLWVSNDIFNAIKSIIRKSSKNSTMPSSEIAKYLSKKRQIVLQKNDVNKKLFRKRTMKNIYDMYMIKEKVTFTIEEICNNCDSKIDIYNFQKLINDTYNDILWAKCPFCKSAYLPKLKVRFGDEINKNNKLINSTSIVDEVILYSPKTLKMNFFDNSNIDVDNLKLNYNPIFWNLIWYFKINGLPFDFFLPYEENIFSRTKIKNSNFFKISFNKNPIQERRSKTPEKDERKYQSPKINNIFNIKNSSQLKITSPNLISVNKINNKTNNILKNYYVFKTPVKASTNPIKYIHINHTIKNNTNQKKKKSTFINVNNIHNINNHKTPKSIMINTNNINNMNSRNTNNINQINTINTINNIKNFNNINNINPINNISTINNARYINNINNIKCNNSPIFISHKKNYSYSNINITNNNNLINNIMINKYNNNMINKPITNNSMFNNAYINKPMINKPMINNPMINNSMINKRMINNSMINNSMINKPMINNPMINNSMINKPMINNPMINNNMINNNLSNKKYVSSSMIINNNGFNIINYNNNYNNVVYNKNNYNAISRINLKKGQVYTHNFINSNYNTNLPYFNYNINYQKYNQNNNNYFNFNNSYDLGVNKKYYLYNNKKPIIPIQTQYISSYVYK